jgi:AraC-like DNA-binding protein
MPPNSLFDTLNRFLHPKPLKPSPVDRVFLERFQELVNQHQAEPEFTTAEAAAQVGMSRMHLNRKLRALTGQSIHDYILGKRLERAHDLLSGPLPIESIAKSVGFRSSSHFSQVFRQRFGTTPSAFRARESWPRQPTREDSSR